MRYPFLVHFSREIHCCHQALLSVLSANRSPRSYPMRLKIGAVTTRLSTTHYPQSSGEKRAKQRPSRRDRELYRLVKSGRSSTPPISKPRTASDRPRASPGRPCWVTAALLPRALPEGGRESFALFPPPSTAPHADAPLCPNRSLRSADNLNAHPSDAPHGLSPGERPRSAQISNPITDAALPTRSPATWKPQRSTASRTHRHGEKIPCALVS